MEGFSSLIQDDHTSLWKYVTEVEKVGRGGENWRRKCSYCGSTFSSSYSRVKAHFMRISWVGIKMCQSVIRDMTEEMEHVKIRLKVSMPVFIFNFKCGGRKCKRSKWTEEEGSIPWIKHSIKRRDELDCIIARMFYTGGLSFNLTRNSWYVKAFKFITTNPIDGYKPLDYNSLRTTLLKCEKSYVERMMEPIRGTWK